MRTIEIVAHIDEHGRLEADVRGEAPPGTVKISLMLPSSTEEDDAGAAWMSGVAHEWSDELADTRQDIYTLDDGEPADGTR